MFEFVEVKYNRICYFTNWGAHRSIKESRLYPEDIPVDLCTHILYAFANLNGRSLQPQLANDIHVYQGEQVRISKQFILKISFFFDCFSHFIHVL
jgi:GH18 family chitinase